MDLRGLKPICAIKGAKLMKNRTHNLGISALSRVLLKQAFTGRISIIIEQKMPSGILIQTAI
jgi:hypothetical protein